jgi:hypothetical protein
MAQDTRLVHLIAASKQLFKLPVRADRLKHVPPIVISNFSVASRMGQAASASNFSVAATEELALRVLSYKAVFSIRATK